MSWSGLREIQRLLGSVCLRTWQSYVSHVDFDSFIFLCVYFDGDRLLRSFPAPLKPRHYGAIEVLLLLLLLLLFIPPPIKMEKFATRRYAIFSPYKLPKVNHSLLLPTHYTEHHPVISHRDVPPQECCTSGTPSAMPKDRFPASTFDSHLQSASFGDHIAN